MGCDMIVKFTPGWLDTIVEPGDFSRVVPKYEPSKTVPVVDQLQRVWDAAEFIHAGKFASAAHKIKELRDNNPWIPKR
jgi:hypothetical protein